jgi:hypothetical protein
VPQLPFLYTAELVEQNGQTVVRRLSCSVWPATSQDSARAGETFDHTGEAPYDARDELTAGKNRRLRVTRGPMEGEYRIVGATPQPFTRHIALELIRVKAVG